MTTATSSATRPGAVSTLVGAGLVCVALGLAAATLGAVTRGAPAAYGALVGTLLVVAVLGLGSLAVDLVAGLMPTAALLVALLTYALQVVLMGLVFVALSGSGLLDGTLDRGWVGGTVIGGTVVWLVSQVVLTSRLRIPAYDLPEAGAR